jgi:hypothetical protein
MESFLVKVPEFHISSMKSALIMGDVAKSKTIDVAKINFVVKVPGRESKKVEVDFMPTIGQEK